MLAEAADDLISSFPVVDISRFCDLKGKKGRRYVVGIDQFPYLVDKYLRLFKMDRRNI